MAYKGIENIAVDYNDPSKIASKMDEADDNNQLNIPADGMFDWLAVMAVGNFAAENPERWKTIALKLAEPGLSQSQIARRLGLHQATVSRHLRKLNIFTGW